MAENDILDRAHLSKYTLGDPALEKEVLNLFIGQVPETLASLKSSADERSWIRAAHTIKGSARAVGAWKLAEAAARAESASTEVGRWEHLAAEVAAAIAEVRHVICAIELQAA